MLIISQKRTEHKKNINYFSYAQIKTLLLEKKEIALLDVREEAIFAEAHPLFAANLPYSRIEIEAYSRIPRLNTTIVIYDNGEGLAEKALSIFIKIGYSEVHLLKGGLKGWELAGGEIFRDVNSPSKAFGELVESKRHTPSLSAKEVKTLIDNQDDILIVDARRFDEYQTMNIPTSQSVPGAELVLRVRELVQRPETKIIVNCAGRTRSIIGTQSLINVNIPNQVFALRNGTIGWTLDGQALEHGQNRKYTEVGTDIKQKAITDSRKVASRAGVKRTNLLAVKQWLKERNRTSYCFDVRTNEEYEAGHLPDFWFVPGGQLVQETDHYAPVRGARIVLADNLEVRANMTASWLAQMGWEVYVIDYLTDELLTDTTTLPVKLPIPDSLPEIEASTITPETLVDWLNKQTNTIVIDFSLANQYIKGHIPGAWYALRSQLNEAFEQFPEATRYVLTSTDQTLANYVFAGFKALTDKDVFVLSGGNQGWIENGYLFETGDSPEKNHFASPLIDRYRRPYEGTDNPVKAMQDYLEWEYGLVDQLELDGTHGFYVI
ncbi:rhodanese homology domain-containing protein [Emticicia sp. BO119]|uniref:rhodanese homology domain-containing protein n=1 Tax=Emticicia sp. BO119 TaxID=2757768 RepID=UPI0015F02F6B|nr:rhodanese homology domain-containing protein [Emticicia sp. BO119]MBA4850573.1 rhodanese-related sulfurtransferase [Emticicia sp. BO119]